jgi:hypothetical protein
MRYAWPSKQCCWLGSSRYPCCRRVATKSNTITNAYADPNGNGNGYGDAQCYANSNSNRYGHAQCYTNSYSHCYG